MLGVKKNQPENQIANPFYHSSNYLFFGFVFSIIALCIPYVEFVCLSIGVVLTYVASSSLKSVNAKFLLAYRLATFRLFFHVVYIFFFAKDVWSLIEMTEPTNSIQAIIILLLAVQMILTHFAYKDIFKEYQLVFHTELYIALSVVLSLVAFYLLKFGENYIQIYFLLLPVIVSFLLYYMQKNTRDGLENAPISVQLPPRKRSNFKVHIYCYLLFIVLLFVFNITSTIQPVKNAKATSLEEQYQETRATLIKKGMPKDLVRDLKDEEISMLKDFKSIEVFNTVQEGIKLNSAYVLSNEDVLYVISNYISMGDKMNYGTGLQSSLYHDPLINDIEIIGGRNLYEKEGILYEMPFLELSREKFFSTWSNKDQISTFATINFPFDATNQRGYFVEKIENVSSYVESGWQIIICFLNYHHEISVIQLPHQDVKKTLKTTSYSEVRNRIHYKIHADDYEGE